MPAGRADWSTRVFEALLALYPRGFRDEYGRELTLLFGDRYRDASSVSEQMRIWLEAISGLAAQAPKEHWRMILQDVRYALRTVRRNALFAATIIFTLALGIGANSSVFSLLNAVILRTLPVPNPEQLFVIREQPRPASHLGSTGPLTGDDKQRFSWPTYERLRGAVSGDGIAAMSRVSRMHADLSESTGSGMASVQLVSGEYFPVLKARVALGRPLLPEDNRTVGAHPVAVISHGYWRRRFGGSPDILGSQIALNGARFTIVGVGPEGFSGVWLESPVDVWLPVAMQGAVRYSQNYSASNAETNKPWMPQERIWWLDIIARAAPDATGAISDKLNAASPGHQKLVMEPFGTGFSGLRQRFSKPLYVLMAMAGLVLLIASANAASLLMARAAGRQREIAVRLSLGAGRMRLVQQLLTESLLLVAAAGAAALLIARWAGDFLVRMATASSGLPAPFAVAVDMRVLAFTAAVALVTSLLFGLAPALQSTRAGFAGALKSSARNVSGGARSGQARALVVLQVGLSLVLVTGTALLVQSFRNMLRLDLGFEREHVLSVSIDPRLADYSSPQLTELYRRLLDRVGAVPGVRSASVAMCGLINGCRALIDGYSVEGYQPRKGEVIAFVVNAVSPGYFSTVGMRLVDGRPFDERDTRDKPGVAVVNETLARRYFAGGRAVGKRFGEGKLITEIVGVVADARVLGVREQATPMAYYSIQQSVVAARVIEVRTTGEPGRAAAAVRAAVAEAEPRLPMASITPLAEIISRTLSQERLVLSLTSAFSALALGLAGFGLFGVLSYAVARRTSEFGIRIALGATPITVIRSVVREALLLALFGVALGLPVVAAGPALFGAMLFDVNPRDWVAVLGATAVLVAVASVAGLLPAWRASRVDPAVALRQE